MPVEITLPKKTAIKSLAEYICDAVLEGSNVEIIVDKKLTITLIPKKKSKAWRLKKKTK